MRVVLVDRNGHVVGGLGAGQRVERCADLRDAPHVRQPALDPEPLDERDEFRVHEERLRGGMAHDRGDLGRGEAAAHGDDDRAELDRREVDDGILGPVRRHHGDAVAALHAGACEGAGDLVRARVERAVRHAVGADDVGGPVAADGRVTAQDVAEEQHAT